MKKLIMFGLFATAAVYADDDMMVAEKRSPETTSMTQTATPAPKRSSYIKVGGSYTHVHFKPKGLSSFHGNLGGAQGIYEYRPANNIYEAVKLNWRQGEMHGGSAGKRHLIDFDPQVRLGYTWRSSCHNFLLTPFTGFGWRYLAHNLKQSGQPSLHFNYNEVYIPVGLLADYKIDKCFSVGFYATWMPQVFSTVNIVPIGNARWVIKNRCGNVLVELPLTYNFIRESVMWSLSLKPFFQYWQDGKTFARTTTGIPLGLPGNTYRFWGAELNIGCAF